jgi:hypothetical protein
MADGGKCDTSNMVFLDPGLPNHAQRAAQVQRFLPEAVRNFRSGPRSALDIGHRYA